MRLSATATRRAIRPCVALVVFWLERPECAAFFLTTSQRQQGQHGSAAHRFYSRIRAPSPLPVYSRLASSNTGGYDSDDATTTAASPNARLQTRLLQTLSLSQLQEFLSRNRIPFSNNDSREELIDLLLSWHHLSHSRENMDEQQQQRRRTLQEGKSVKKSIRREFVAGDSEHNISATVIPARRRSSSPSQSTSAKGRKSQSTPHRNRTRRRQHFQQHPLQHSHVSLSSSADRAVQNVLRAMTTLGDTTSRVFRDATRSLLGGNDNDDGVQDVDWEYVFTDTHDSNGGRQSGKKSSEARNAAFYTRTRTRPFPKSRRRTPSQPMPLDEGTPLRGTTRPPPPKRRRRPPPRTYAYSPPIRSDNSRTLTLTTNGTPRLLLPPVSADTVILPPNDARKQQQKRRQTTKSSDQKPPPKNPTRQQTTFINQDVPNDTSRRHRKGNKKQTKTVYSIWPSDDKDGDDFYEQAAVNTMNKLGDLIADVAEGTHFFNGTSSSTEADDDDDIVEKDVTNKTRGIVESKKLNHNNDETQNDRQTTKFTSRTIVATQQPETCDTEHRSTPATTKKGRHWRDRLEERLDHALGLHQDGKYYKSWQDQLERGNEEQKNDNDHDGTVDALDFFFRRGGRKKARVDHKVPFWEEDASLLSLLFARPPTGKKNHTLKQLWGRKKGKKNVETNICTIVFRTMFHSCIVLTSRLCRWTSCRGAIPQPIVLFLLVASTISAPPRRRLWTVSISIVALRTIAEIIYYYVHTNGTEDRWNEDPNDDRSSHFSPTVTNAMENLDI